MPSDIVTKWLKSRHYAAIQGKLLRPRKHPSSPGLPLSVQRGQAEVFFLEEDNQTSWILKKFYQSKLPHNQYLHQISTLLPQHDAFSSGCNRNILNHASLVKSGSNYYHKELALWLEHTLLMPKVKGSDWTTITDGLRDNTAQLPQTQRVNLCHKLAQLVKQLEDNKLSHRDLSSSNVFIDLANDNIHLIDFDSMYHPSLIMPESTTMGSEGYMAPFIKQGQSTWCQMADRFALAILNTEFLILNEHSPYCGEGGIFNQEDIYKRSGKTITYAQDELQRQYPKALELFNSAINSTSFKQCPAPEQWMELSHKIATNRVDCGPDIDIMAFYPKHNYQLPNDVLSQAYFLKSKPVTLDLWIKPCINNTFYFPANPNLKTKYTINILPEFNLDNIKNKAVLPVAMPDALSPAYFLKNKPTTLDSWIKPYINNAFHIPANPNLKTKYTINILPEFKLDNIKNTTVLPVTIPDDPWEP